MKKFLRELFSDNNTLNEKSVAGFIALLVMILAFSVNIYAIIRKIPFTLNEFIFDGFLYIVLGAFGIAEVGKIFGNKNLKSKDKETEEISNDDEPK
jgi:hypothetical protein